MFGDGFDMNAILAQAQEMQAQFQAAQEQLAASTFRGSVAGGLVEATLTGEGNLTELVIKPEAVDLEDLESLADLVIAAVRTAKHEVDLAAAQALPSMPTGF